jgi:hypothetical protein
MFPDHFLVGFYCGKIVKHVLSSSWTSVDSLRGRRQRILGFDVRR